MKIGLFALTVSFDLTAPVTKCAASNDYPEKGDCTSPLAVIMEEETRGRPSKYGLCAAHFMCLGRWPKAKRTWVSTVTHGK